MVQIFEVQKQTEENLAKYECLKAYKAKEDLFGIEQLDLMGINIGSKYIISLAEIHYETYIVENSSEVVVNIPKEVTHIQIKFEDEQIHLDGKNLTINIGQCLNEELNSAFCGIIADSITINIKTDSIKRMVSTFKNVQTNKLLINTSKDGFKNLTALNQVFEDSIIGETNLLNYNMPNLDRMFETFVNCTYGQKLIIKGMPKLKIMYRTFQNTTLQSGIDTSGLCSDKLSELTYAFQFTRKTNKDIEIDLSNCDLSKLADVAHNFNGKNIKFKLDTSQLGRLETFRANNTTAIFLKGNVEIETTSKEKLLDLSKIRNVDSTAWIKITKHNISKVKIKVTSRTDQTFKDLLRDLSIEADGVIDWTNIEVTNTPDEINTYRVISGVYNKINYLANDIMSKDIHKIIMRKSVYELMQKCFKYDLKNINKAKIEIKVI